MRKYLTSQLQIQSISLVSYYSTATVEIAHSDYPNGLFSVSLAGSIHSLVIQENYTDLIIGTVYRDCGTICTPTSSSSQDLANPDILGPEGVIYRSIPVLLNMS